MIQHTETEETSMRNTSLCYLEKDGKVLLLHRVKKKEDANRGKWIGIGGGFEDGESPEECMLREMKEETGLELTSYRFRGIVTFVSDEAQTEYMHLFTADDYRGKLAEECDEGELAWVEKEKMDELPMWKGDALFLKLLEMEIPFFSLKLCYQGDQLVRSMLNGEEIQA